ncbi:MAG: hypothetical protein RI932_1889 [Pseudomonadota bacterium]|jgi:hypothetical protein
MGTGTQLKYVQVLGGALLSLVFSCSSAEVDDFGRVKLSECTEVVCLEKQKETRRIKLSELEAQENQRSNPNQPNSPSPSGQIQQQKTLSNDENNNSNPSVVAIIPARDERNPDLNPTPVYVELWEPRATSEKVIQHCAICHTDWVGNKSEVIRRRTDSVSRIQSGNMPRAKVLNAAERQLLINMFNAL